MELVATVEALLRQSPRDALCAACLSFACGVSLLEMRGVIERLVSDGQTIEIAPTCASCRRAVPSAHYRLQAGKCVHCSKPVEPYDQGIVFEGELYHAACLRVLVSEDAIRASRDLTRRSLRLIEDARRHIGKKPRDE